MIKKPKLTVRVTLDTYTIPEAIKIAEAIVERLADEDKVSRVTSVTTQF